MCLSVEAGTGRIIECNQTLVDVFGYAKEEVLTKHLIDLYPHEEREKVQDNIEAFNRDGTLVHSEFRVLKANGELLDVSLKLNAVRDDDGNILYSNAIWRDITELKRVQRALEAEKQKSEELLLNILPRSIVDRLTSSPATIADGIENATILFCDIDGFTELSQRVAPEKLISILNVVFSEFDHLVGFFGLEKIKTIGDAYMVAAGLPEPRDDHAVVMAKLAREMCACVDRLNTVLETPVSVRIGIESGSVVAGVIGKKKFAYDLWGDSVNMAARMEAHGMAGEIQVGPVAHGLLRDLFDFEDRGHIDLKGKGPTRCFLLRSEKPALADTSEPDVPIS